MKELFRGVTKMIKWFFAIMFFPITLPVWLFRRKKHTRRTQSRDLSRIAKEPDCIAKHFAYDERIGQMYSVAKSKKNPHSRMMDEVIKACRKDIALAEECKKYWCKIDPYLREFPVYRSFVRLAIIYEQRKEYEEAIRVCRTAIRLGYDDDGTEGRFPGRIARLANKIGNDVQIERGRK